MNGLINTHAEIEKAINLAESEHNPRHWFVAYSGGSDSAVVLQALLETGLYQKYNMDVMTIDTGLSSEGHLWRVISEITEATGSPPIIYTGGGWDWYKNNVLEYGFGYRIQHHAPYYQYLKREAIHICMREYKQNRLDRIAFITGVRRVESRFRAKRPLLQRNGARLTVNAIATFTDDDKIPYLNRAIWYKGKTTHDCMCNWHCQFKPDDLKGSGMYEPVKELSEQMINDGMWGYGQEPKEDWMIDDSVDDDMPEDSLCVDCLKQMTLKF